MASGSPPAETRLVSTFPAARPGGLARGRPHHRSRGRRGLVSPGGGPALGTTPPPTLLPPLSTPSSSSSRARHVPDPAPTRHAGNPGDVTILQHWPSRALQKRREGGDVSGEGYCGCAGGLASRTSCGAVWWKTSGPTRSGNVRENVTDVISRRRQMTAA